MMMTGEETEERNHQLDLIKMQLEQFLSLEVVIEKESMTIAKKNVSEMVV